MKDPAVRGSARYYPTGRRPATGSAIDRSRGSRDLVGASSAESLADDRGAVRSGFRRWAGRGRTLPVLTILATLAAIWYAGAVWLNAPQLIDRYARVKTPWTTGQLVQD